MFKTENDVMTDELKQYVFGIPNDYEGTREKPYIRIGCYDRDMGVTLYWGNVMSDMYPSGEGDAVRVAVRFNQHKPLDLGWVPSDDFTTTFPPNSVGGAFMGLGEGLLGAFIPGRGNVNFTWKPQDLHRIMLRASRMVVRASNRGAGYTTIVFDLTGYADVVRSNFRSHCQ